MLVAEVAVAEVEMLVVVAETVEVVQDQLMHQRQALLEQQIPVVGVVVPKDKHRVLAVQAL
jgi:hypothetical protein